MIRDDLKRIFPPRNPEAPLRLQEQEKSVDWARIGWVAFGLFLATSIATCSMTAISVHNANSRDLDGHYAAQDPAMHAWFDKLASGRGLCCSFADGRSVADPDWGTEAIAGADGQSQVRYWVIVDGKRITVPPDALVTEPNRYGPAVVWPYLVNGEPAIRCFLPGALT